MIHTHTLVADAITPVHAYAALRRAAGDAASFLLESVVAGERWGRYSILGYRPRIDEVLLPSGVWQISGGKAAAHARTGDRAKRESADVRLGTSADPLQAAEHLFRATEARTGASPAESFARAHVGYMAYDLVHAIEKVPGWQDRITAPLARFVGGATIVVFDNLRQTLTIASEDPAAVEQARADLANAPAMRAVRIPDRSKIPSRIDVSMSDERYEAEVRRAQEYIAAGDAFQVVLARKFQVAQNNVDPLDVYRAMRVLNPSPYMYFLDFPPAPGETSRMQVLGASPETMVRLEGGVMTVRPLAGTRPRGATEEEDLRHERELLADPKERAEHVMLIDLGRNDVGRVARIGSVELLRRMEIERYSHVMHIVSEVRGIIPPSTPPLEVIRAAFPAGTLSGAPKVRAMQIIRELESGPRGIYGGAVGYVSGTGDLDFAIAIRTAVCRGGVFEVTAGAGIVEGSVPRLEAEETWNKARSVLSALESASISP